MTFEYAKTQSGPIIEALHTCIQALAKKYDLFQETAGGVWGGSSSATPGKLCNFYPHLNLQTVSST